MIFVDIQYVPFKIRPFFKFNMSKFKSFAHYMYRAMAVSFIGLEYPINRSKFQTMKQEKAKIYEILT